MGGGDEISSRFDDDVDFINTMSSSPTQRRDMRGPEGVDDILNELKNELDLEEVESIDLGEKPKRRRRKKKQSVPTFN